MDKWFGRALLFSALTVLFNASWPVDSWIWLIMQIVFSVAGVVLIESYIKAVKNG